MHNEPSLNSYVKITKEMTFIVTLLAQNAYMYMYYEVWSNAAVTFSCKESQGFCGT